MRYYEVKLPGEKEPCITTAVKQLRELPDGTTIAAIVTERDGTLIESYAVPIVNGRPQIAGRGKHRPEIWHGRPA